MEPVLTRSVPAPEAIFVLNVNDIALVERSRLFPIVLRGLKTRIDWDRFDFEVRQALKSLS